MTGFDETVPPDDVAAEGDGTAATQATENDPTAERPLHDSKSPALEDEPNEDEPADDDGAPAGQWDQPSTSANDDASAG